MLDLVDGGRSYCRICWTGTKIPSHISIYVMCTHTCMEYCIVRHTAKKTHTQRPIAVYRKTYFSYLPTTEIQPFVQTVDVCTHKHTISSMDRCR